ncbi:endonuclease [Caerostris extrusa]|uniref:Endonuclease n=1 Tax=Caerostris extrusa TaxID=172846 RepID=A0AAV4QDE7_CAEEX|nr:endonuclease [Caerostris extrusa]
MQTLYSDRGSNFLSAAMNEVYEKLGISKQHTLAYNPQGNGLVERLNKTLIDTLSHLVSEKQEDWCQHVPLALMAFRSAHHRSIQETPAFLVYGRDLQMPYDLIFRDQTVSELVLVRKDHSTGAGESPPQAVDDHSPPNSSTAQVAVSHRYNLRPRNAMGFVK